MRTGGQIRLVVLDFDGVCTLSSAEALTGASAGTHRHGPGTITLRPEAAQLVSDLSAAGIATAVLSNEISEDWVTDVPLLGLVDHVVNCADNKIFKPDRRAFQRCSVITSVPPEAMLVVDDQLDNVTVAASLDMNTVLFDVGDPARSWEAVRRSVWP